MSQRSRREALSRPVYKNSPVKVPLFAVAISGGQSIKNAAFTRQIFNSYSLLNPAVIQQVVFHRSGYESNSDFLKDS